MKKKLFVLIAMLFLTGCSVDYNIYIDDGVVYENTNFIVPNTEDNQSYFSNLITYGESAYFDVNTAKSYPYTMKDFITKDDKLGLNYEYDFFFGDYANSKFISECFNNRVFVYDEDVITLETNDGIMCMYQDGIANFEDLTVTISSPYVVKENNADEVIDDVYKWYFDSSNYNTKGISISFNKKTTVEDIKNDNIDKYSLYIILGIGVIVLLFALRMFYLYNKTK